MQASEPVFVGGSRQYLAGDRRMLAIEHPLECRFPRTRGPR
jgi:hypothetical protein